LIQDDKARATLEAASRPPRVRATAGGHRRDESRSGGVGSVRS
jgi:hypothetical protein